MNRLEVLRFLFILILCTCTFIGLLIITSFLFVKHHEIREKSIENFKNNNDGGGSNWLTKTINNNEEDDKSEYYKVNLSIETNMSIPIKRSTIVKTIRKFGNSYGIVNNITKINLLTKRSKKMMNTICPDDSEFYLGLNNKCFKLIKNNNLNDNGIKICENLKANLFEIKNNEDISILKNMVEEYVESRYFDVGIRCDSKSNCRYISSNESVEKNFKPIYKKTFVSCRILYNIESKSFECNEEINLMNRYPYFCQKDISLVLKSCSDSHKIRRIDNYCYNKKQIINYYSKKVAENICLDMKMKLPILETSINIGKNFSREMNATLWVDMECEDNEILKCKWKNGNTVDIEHYFSFISISKRKKKQNCVIIDSKQNELQFSSCAKYSGVFCQSES